MTENIYDNVVLLNRIVLENEVEIFSGIRLVPFPPTLGKKGENIPRYVSEWSPAAGGIRYFFYKTQLIIDSSVVSEFNIDQLCQALSLACNSGIQIATSIQVKMDEEPFSMVPYTGPSVTYIEHDPVKESDIEEVKRLYELLDNLEPDVQRKLHIPINRWIKSHVLQSAMVDKMIDSEIPPEKIAEAPTTRDVDKMIDLGIAFESVYLSGISATTELAFRIRLHASLHLGKNKEDRQMLIEKFKKIYEWRSKAVHTGTLSTKDVRIGEEVISPLVFIKQTQDLCRKSILKIIEEGQFPHWNDIILGCR